MAATSQSAIAVIGIDIGKNSFHVVGLDERGAIVLRQKWSRAQVEVRLTNMPIAHATPPALSDDPPKTALNKAVGPALSKTRRNRKTNPIGVATP